MIAKQLSVVKAAPRGKAAQAQQRELYHFYRCDCCGNPDRNGEHEVSYDHMTYHMDKLGPERLINEMVNQAIDDLEYTDQREDALRWLGPCLPLSYGWGVLWLSNLNPHELMDVIDEALEKPTKASASANYKNGRRGNMRPMVTMK